MDDSRTRQSLNHRASEQTLISLLELDPSPIDSPTPADEKQLHESIETDESDTIMAKSSDSASLRTTDGPGLGNHSGHGSIFYRTGLFPPRSPISASQAPLLTPQTPPQSPESSAIPATPCPSSPRCTSPTCP